jgi:hypothetical protein
MYFWENNADRALQWAKDKKKRGETYKDLGEELPKNRDIKADKHKDKILRELDCKVIEFMHDQIIHQVA